MTVTYHGETHHSKCSKCLLLALRHAVKQSRHWSINWSMKLCWLLTIFQSGAISTHGHTSLVSDKHVPALRFQSVSPGAGALVWFSCSQRWKWMVHRTITVMSCCSNSCCQTSVKLLVTFTFQCTTRAQEHQAAETQDSGLHTRHAASQETGPQSCRLYGQSFRNAFIRNSKCRYTSPISCGY